MKVIYSCILWQCSGGKWGEYIMRSDMSGFDYYSNVLAVNGVKINII